jgi:hypothetical protein
VFAVWALAENLGTIEIIVRAASTAIKAVKTILFQAILFLLLAPMFSLVRRLPGALALRVNLPAHGKGKQSRRNLQVHF